MEPQENAENPSKSPPDRLALAAAVCAVTGVGLSGVALGLAIANELISSASALLDRVMDISLIIAIPLGYIIAPSLVLVTSWMAVAYCRQLERSKGGAVNTPCGHRTAWRLLVAGVALAVASGFVAMWAILHGWCLHAVFGGLSAGIVSVSAVAACAGCASARLYRRRPGAFGRRLCGRSTILAVVLVGVAFTPIPDYLSYYSRRSAYALGGETFAGRSEALPGTTVVATLNCPVAVGTNVVWCSSFQLAWNELRGNVMGEPVNVIGAEALAERLNAAGQSAADLEPRSAYAAAGRIEEGIVDTIEESMSSRFPSATLPDFGDYSGIPRAVIAYSYLVAQVPFTHPYRQVARAFTFTDSQGVETNVKAFGLWEAFLSQYKDVREQIDILFARSSDPNGRHRDLDEYAIDLCRHSEPYQVVVARVDLKRTLGETLDYVRLRASEFEASAYYENMKQFQSADVLKVPEMFWEVEHRFQELIGKRVANAEPSMSLVEAMQTIRFRLDRYGAMIESQANIAIAAAPRHFEFNRPFLVYMKKRGGNHPFFVMWVDNAELLTPR